MTGKKGKKEKGEEKTEEEGGGKALVGVSVADCGTERRGE